MRVTQDPTISQNADDLQRARRQSSERLRPPTEVPGYEFERFLGAGAYGEVWVAVDRNTGRRTAIKFYAHRGGVDWSLLSREVEKLALLFADLYGVQVIDVCCDARPAVVAGLVVFVGWAILPTRIGGQLAAHPTYRRS